MNIPPEYLIERRKNKRLLVIWKSLFLLLFLISIALILSNINIGSFSSGMPSAQKDYIANIYVDGIIYEDNEKIKKLSKIENNDNIKALIVNMNSAGGSVVGSEMLYNALIRIKDKKPIVVVMQSIATSGAYLASLAADHIIAHNGTITGSIGVIMQTAEFTELAHTLGIQFLNFKSGEFKATPNPTEKITPAIRESLMSNIYDIHDYFVNLVAQRRSMNIEFVKQITDGRVYSAKKALELKLIDEIGDNKTATNWLVTTKNIDPNLSIKDVSLVEKKDFLEIVLNNIKGMVKELIPNSIFFNNHKSYSVQAI